MTRSVRPVGDRALLLECGDDDPAALAVAVRAAELDGVVDVVPAAVTVLVTFDRAEGPAGAVGALLELAPAPVGAAGDDVVLPVSYDGPDLAAVAAACGLSVDEVVDRHRSTTYRVSFCGFSPGFAYLVGLDPALHLPRRADPRTRVPAGALAIAGPFTAVYPRPSPGGWHLVGSCPSRLWDPTARPPALLTPGSRVRFQPS